MAMSGKYQNVIVFGPTGAVGSYVALEASKRGAKVWLAMRDTSKTIHCIPKEESTGSFERVQADLSDPPSIKQAIEKTGAKAAYFYQVQVPGGMKKSIEAMKEGGIEYVVFLSSFTIRPDDPLDKFTMEQPIPFIHAQVEKAIEECGLAATMLRPGAFAYNTFWQNMDISKEPWMAYIRSSGIPSDCISTVDIGRVGGAVLVDRPSTKSKEVIYLYGPDLLSQREQLDIIQNVAGKRIEIIEQDQSQYRQFMIDKGLPGFVVDYLLKFAGADSDKYYPEHLLQQSASDIEKYLGSKATTFAEFIPGYLSKKLASR